MEKANMSLGVLYYPKGTVENPIKTDANIVLFARHQIARLLSK